MTLKESFSQVCNFNFYEAKTKTIKTAWLSFTNENTGRTVTVKEVEDSIPEGCTLEIKDNQFRFTRKI